MPPRRRTYDHVRVAVDGPSGAGKSTVARRVAKVIGADYIDTGAMYRAIALKILAA
jgi:cytidylate kinase